MGDIIRVTVGQKVYDYSVTSTTIATFLPLFVAAFNALDASDYPEMAEMTAGGASPDLTFTADTAGVPFTITLTPLESNGGAADAQTIEGAGTATTGTATTASSGPNDWGTAKNWSGGAVPSSSDNVYFENSDDDIKYGFGQSAVTLTLLEIRASFTGTIGLPLINSDATEYPEYRDRALAVSATTLNVGDGDGQGSGRIIIDVGSNACTLTVRRTSGGLDTDIEALQWKGTHVANVVNVYRGEVAVAGYAAEAATVATLRVGFEDGQDSDARVRMASGCTLTTITQTGGELEINSAATTITRHGGSLTVKGAGAVTTLTNNAGEVDYRGTGTVTTYVGGPQSVLRFTADNRARTFTTTTVLAGAEITDLGGTVTWTNPILLSRCKLADVRIDVGFNRSIGIT